MKIEHKIILIAIIITIIAAAGTAIFYRIDNPVVITEIEYVDRVVVEKEIEYIEVDNLNWQEFEVTGYSANDPQQGTNNIVATTFNLDYTRVQNLPICATDPDVIPLYSIVEIKDMGAYISLDTGGLIKGNRIDILFDSKQEALEFGRQKLAVRVVE